MDESDALVLVAEVAVAIAGFSSIATALGARGTRAAPGADKDAAEVARGHLRRDRFVYMLSQSGTALFASLVTLVLLYRLVEQDRALSELWIGASLVWAVSATVGTTRGFLRGRAARNESTLDSRIGLSIIVTCFFIIALQIYNMVSAQAFWPFLAGLVWNLAFAFIQFMRIVLATEDEPIARDGAY